MAYDTGLERRIRERAFQIWIEEGRPHGCDREHWLMAEAELVSGTSSPLQPGSPAGEVCGERGQTQRTDQPLVVGGINPDDVTR